MLFVSFCRPIVIAVLAAFFSVQSAAGGILLLDTFSPPAFGGFSSPNNGAATQVEFLRDGQISQVAVKNEMLSDGYLRFAVWSFPSPSLLYISDAKFFAMDGRGSQTWKESDDLDIEFNVGDTFLVGYYRSVGVNEDLNNVGEQTEFAKSSLQGHCLSGFDTPGYSHRCFNGGEFSVRIYGIPEPSAIAIALILAGAAAGRAIVRRVGR